MAKTDRAARDPVTLPSGEDADAPADPPEPDTQRHSVLAAIGRLIYEGCLRLQAEGGVAEGETETRDPNDPNK